MEWEVILVTHENLVHGSSASEIVQARTVQGGVHFHQRQPGLPVPRQLPIAPPLLVAREREFERLTEALTNNGIVVILGAGGIGKSALALRWAHDHVDRFPEGQLYAQLDHNSSPLSVLHGFLIALGIAPDRVPSDVDSAAALYRSSLAGRKMVVVLDNAVGVEQIRPLLPSTCAVVITSRSRLGSLHSVGAKEVLLDVLSHDQSRTLLARSVNVADGALDRLVDCCAGLPLALAIVAARAAMHPSFPLSLLADELSNESERLDALDAGDGALNLRAVLSWSLAALNTDEAMAFRAIGSAPVRELSVAAVASLLGLPSSRAARLLRALESNSLLRQHQPGRYRMHDLVRLHAAESPEDPDGLRRLLDFYVHTARAADRALFPYRAQLPVPEAACVPLTFADDLAALDWFVMEYHQLLAALDEAERRGWDPHVWHLARALDTFQHRHGHGNVDTSLSGVHAADRMGNPLARVLAHRQLGRAWTRAGADDHAVSSLTTALELAEDQNEQAHTHHDLARAFARQGSHESAAEHARCAVVAYQAVRNMIGEAHALNALGREHAELGDVASAQHCCERALALHESSGNVSGVMVTLDNLGDIAHRAGQPAKAIEYYTAALEACRARGDRFLESEVTEHLGRALAAQGNDRAATEMLDWARELRRRLGT